MPSQLADFAAGRLKKFLWWSRGEIEGWIKRWRGVGVASFGNLRFEIFPSFLGNFFGVWLCERCKMWVGRLCFIGYLYLKKGFLVSGGIVGFCRWEVKFFWIVVDEWEITFKSSGCLIFFFIVGSYLLKI